MKIYLTYRINLFRLVATLLLCVSVASAQGKSPSSVAIFPFESQESLLGVAVSERVADALTEAEPAIFDKVTDVLGPDVALALVPPFAVQNGFLNPLIFLGESQNTSSRTAATLLQGALGVDMALTGQIEFAQGELELTFHLSTPRGVQTFSTTASEENPAELARTVLAVLQQQLRRSSPKSETEFDKSVQHEVKAINLDTPYGDYVEAVALLSGGLVEEARIALERAVRSEEDEGERARYQQLLNTLEAVEAGKSDTVDNLPLAATLSLSTRPPDEAAARRVFRALSGQSDLPAYKTWLGLLEASAGNSEEAAAAFDAAASYPYGRAARALFNALQESSDAQAEAQVDIDTDLDRIEESESPSALLGALLVAQQMEDAALEVRLATQLSHLAPSLPYAFERLSQIAFDENRPLDAAQALSVAAQLEPQSDLYWTNLGWAYYLLGRLEESEDASLQALDLNPDEFIAWYNLGLARAVTGRLGEAIDAYTEALSLDRDPQIDSDPDVDEAAVEDLENALEQYPDVPAVHFALANLYEAQDKTDAAIAQFERYLEKTEDTPRFSRRAEERLRVLRAPPAPLDISENARLSLGPDNLSVETFRPGDRLFPDFEIFTPGRELPQEVTLILQLLGAQDAPVEGTTFEETFPIPGNAVALQIDDIGFSLPTDLEPGRYGLEVALSASRERRASTTLSLEVTGEPLFARRLISQGVTLRSLASNAPLYSERNLALQNNVLTQRLLAELQGSADAAQDALPEITTGRFEGLGGSALFNGSSAEDVSDFLSFLLAQPDGEELSISFVDAYAQWALEGAPTP